MTAPASALTHPAASLAPAMLASGHSLFQTGLGGAVILLPFMPLPSKRTPPPPSDPYFLPRPPVIKEPPHPHAQPHQPIPTRPRFDRDTQIEAHLHLVESLVGSLFKKCGNLLRGLEREDLVQEGRIGLIEAVDSFDASKNASFSTHAFRCIQSALAACLRANGRQIEAFEQVLGEVETFAPVSDETTLRDLRGDLRDAMCGLDERTRRALTLHFLEGHTKTDVAKQLGISRVYCHEIIDAGLSQMRARLTEDDSL